MVAVRRSTRTSEVDDHTTITSMMPRRLSAIAAW
jgi:hypothetical protein